MAKPIHISNQNGSQFRPFTIDQNILHYLDKKFQNFRIHSIMAKVTYFMRMQKVKIPAFIAIFVSVVDTHNIRSYRIIYLSMGISFFFHFISVHLSSVSSFFFRFQFFSAADISGFWFVSKEFQNEERKKNGKRKYIYSLYFWVLAVTDEGKYKQRKNK